MDDSGAVITNPANYTTSKTYPIGEGVHQRIVLSDTAGTSSFYMIYSRDGVNKNTPALSVYDGMVIDLSVLSHMWNAFTPSAVDRVHINYYQGANKTLTMPVVNIPCKRLGYKGSVLFAERNEASPTAKYDWQQDGTGASDVKTHDTLFGYTNAVRHQITRTTPGNYFGHLSVGSVTGRNRDSLTFDIKNNSLASIIVRGQQGGTIDYRTDAAIIKSGESRRIHFIYPHIPTIHNFRVLLISTTDTSSVADFTINNIAVTPGEKPQPFYSPGVNTGNYFVGYATDYADGFFVRPDYAPTRTSPLTGVPFTQKLFYAKFNASTLLEARNLATGTSSDVPSGSLQNTTYPVDYEIINPDGTSYGSFRYKPKGEYPPVNCRVTLRWLNTKGAYDMMNFSQYRINPQYTTAYNGGSRIDEYDVQVSVVVDNDNEDALMQLTRSADVAGIFPIDIGQWAKVNVENHTAFTTQGGSVGKTITFKLTFKIAEM